MRDFVQLFINGKIHQVRGEDVFLSLSDYLRMKVNLRGTKVVCAEGDCGACTVMKARVIGKDGRYSSINSCIAMVALLDGHHIVTIEGISENGEPHEIQKSMVANNGAQCGFCTPGFVMAMTDLFENKKKITEKTSRNFLTGNLCRCTGYGSILDAALSVDPKKSRKISEVYKNLSFDKEDTEIEVLTDHVEFYSPVSMKKALELKSKFPEIRIISSATDLGVQINKDLFRPHRLLSLDKIASQHEVEISEDSISVGSRVTLDKLEKIFEDKDSEISTFLNLFASPQIKNFATLVGNVANASPIGDTLPLLSVMEAKVVAIGENGEREIPFNKFYLGYKKLDLLPEELISKIVIPRRNKGEVLRLYKVSRRKDLDISSVNAAIRIKLDGDTISDIKVAFGGVGPTVLRLAKLEKNMLGKKFVADSFREGSHLIKNEITPLGDVRGSAEYRYLVAKNLFQRFFLEASKEVSQ